MNLFWPIAACTGVFLAIFYEFITWRKERDVRRDLHVDMSRSGKRDQLLSLILFLTTLGSLFVAFCILAFHVKWGDPKDGVAVVFDAGDSPQEKEWTVQQRGFLQELVNGLKGVPLSLYERREGSLSCLAPPTIDRLYFALMADGIQPSPGYAPSLDRIRKEVLAREANSRPWVVVISSRVIPEGAKDMDGISLLVPRLPKILMESFDHGINKTEPSFDALLTRITSRILRSQEAVSLDGFEKTLLFIAVLSAWLSAIHWRRRISPLFWVIFIFLAPSFELSSHEPTSENAIVRQCADLVDAKEYAAASMHLEELLPSIVDGRARQRVMYNLALVAYLREDERAALTWLDSGGGEEGDTQLIQKSRVLRALSLIRLVRKDGVSSVWRKRLEELIKDPFGLPRYILAEASLALLLPRKYATEPHYEERTLLFYSQSLRDLFPLTIKGDIASFVARTQNDVERGLKLFFSDKLVALFRKVCAEEIKDPFFLVRYEPWYLVSKMKTQEEAVQLLLNEGLQTSTEGLLFPRLAPLLEKKLMDIRTLLDGKITLPSEKEPEAISAAWYVRARMWGLFSENHEKEQQEVVLFIAAEMGRSVSPLIKKMLVRELISSLNLSRELNEEPESLGVIFWHVYLKWFDASPLEALDVFLKLAEHNRPLWTEYVTRLIDARRKFFDLSLSNDLAEYDAMLLARLVQIERSPCSLPQEAVQYVNRILYLYKEILARLKEPQKPFFKSLVVILEEHQKLVETLHGSTVFKDDYAKRGNFEGLVDDWAKRTFMLKERLDLLTLQQLPQIQKDLRQCYDVLLRIRNMLDEKEPSSEERVPKGPALLQEKQFSIREEEAVRLYQEMDRMDRTLYGE